MNWIKILLICMMCSSCTLLISQHKPSTNSKRWKEYKYITNNHKVTFKVPKSSYFREYSEDKKINNEKLEFNKDGVVIVTEKTWHLISNDYDYSLYAPVQFSVSLNSENTLVEPIQSLKPKLAKNLAELKSFFSKTNDESKLKIITDKYLEVFGNFAIGGHDYYRYVYWIQIDDYKFISLYVTYGNLIWKDPKSLAVRKKIVEEIINSLKFEKVVEEQ